MWWTESKRLSLLFGVCTSRGAISPWVDRVATGIGTQRCRSKSEVCLSIHRLNIGYAEKDMWIVWPATAQKAKRGLNFLPYQEDSLGRMFRSLLEVARERQLDPKLAGFWLFFASSIQSNHQIYYRGGQRSAHSEIHCGSSKLL